MNLSRFLHFGRSGSGTLRHGFALTPRGVAYAAVRHLKTGFAIESLRYESTEDVSPQTLLRGMSQQFKLKKAAAVMVIPQSLYTLKIIESPNVPPEEMRDAVRWKVKELIDFPVESAIFDLFSIPGQAERKRQLMHYVVIAEQKKLQAQVDLFDQAQIGLEVIDIQEMALRNLVANTIGDENGIALIYLGERHGEITITYQGELYLSRDLSLGCEQIVELINATADEQQPVEEGVLALEVQGLVDKIVLEVQRSLDYYSSSFGLPPISTILLAPLLCPIEGLTSYLSESIGITTHKIDFNQLFQISAQEPPGEKLQAQCLMATAVALRPFE
ncbi:MAG: pilus assembly protein PilM [Gammaproteobacteria bacterium]|nr:pilus assembly protein PilM [Gammaproteobacteria bacterium]